VKGTREEIVEKVIDFSGAGFHSFFCEYQFMWRCVMLFCCSSRADLFQEIRTKLLVAWGLRELLAEKSIFGADGLFERFRV
jgi:hypothetical protein